VQACSMSADGMRMITAGSDRTARVWNEKGECLHVLKGHQDSVTACSISVDGKRMLTASSDGIVRLWNENGKCLHALKGHQGVMQTCVMSTDEQRIITGSPNAIRFWALDPAAYTWKCTQELHLMTQTIIWLDAKSQTLKLKGPDWPFWQLRHSDDQVRNTLGENIAAFGPMAHEQLANAEEWQFLPRDDIQPDEG